IEVRPRVPDLELSALAVPTRASPGDLVGVDYTIANVGTLDVVSTTVVVRFSADDVYDDTDARMCGGPVTGAAAGGTRNGRLAGCLVPAGAAIADGFVVARVDEADTTGESDETDNDAAAPITIVTAPDERPDW